MLIKTELLYMSVLTVSFRFQLLTFYFLPSTSYLYSRFAQVSNASLGYAKTSFVATLDLRICPTVYFQLKKATHFCAAFMGI